MQTSTNSSALLLLDLDRISPKLPSALHLCVFVASFLSAMQVEEEEEEEEGEEEVVVVGVEEAERRW